MTNVLARRSNRSPSALGSRGHPGRHPSNFLYLEQYLAGVISLGVLLIGWELLSRLIIPALNPEAALLMPPPSVVVATGWQLLRSGVLIEHALASTKRVLLAWGAVCLVAIPLGIAMGWWGRFNRYANPITEVLRPIPPLAWIPISILWFGIGLQQNVFIIMIGCFFPVLLNTIHGVRGVDPILVRAAQNFCANEFTILRRVILPAALPNIFTGARIGLGVAWMVLVAAELVAATSGLGFMIEDARNFLRTDIIFVGMITIGFMGILMEGALRLLQARLLVWYHG